MVQSKSLQVKVPPKTYVRLVEFAKAEGIISASDNPIVTQTVYIR